jgi:hypothetical protein
MLARRCDAEFGGTECFMRDFDPNIDYYEVLQVHPRAHREVIKRAYHTIMATLQGHPDLGGSHEAAIHLNQAYAVLSDEDTRKAYDAARRFSMGTGSGTASSLRAAPPRGSTPRVHQPSAVRPASPPRHAEHTTIYCPHCGTRNRLHHGVDARMALCGKCRRPLQRADNPIPNGDAHHREIKLHRRMDRELTRHGELRLHPLHVPRGKSLHCLRCHHEWPALSGNGLPERCPRCRSQWWSDFRVFLCRFCRERFSSNTLIVVPHTEITLWPWPYWLFPACPACGKSHWHHDCEAHPLRGVLNLFSGALREE